MYRCFPTDISTDWLNTHLNEGRIPNMYPDLHFLQEHYQIIKPFRIDISLYKGSTYQSINKYLRTGHGDVETKRLTKRLVTLYKLVKPLPYDIIVYRGVESIIGQNFSKGEYIGIDNRKNTKKCHSLEKIKLVSKIKKTDDPRDYIYENNSFISTSADVFTSFKFSCNGLTTAYILKAGTKFICPIDPFVNDDEFEFMLFPFHNSFILTNLLKLKLFDADKKIYTGILSDSFNKYRLPNHPITHICDEEAINTDVTKCIVDNQKPRYECTESIIRKCAKDGRYCNNGHCSSYVLSNCNDKLPIFFRVNNYIDRRELFQLYPYSKCDKYTLISNQSLGVFNICDPKDGKTVSSNLEKNKKSIERVQKEVDKQKVQGFIIDFDYPNMSLETLKIQSKNRNLPLGGNRNKLINNLLTNDIAYKLKLRHLPVQKISKSHPNVLVHKLEFFYRSYKSESNKIIKEVYKYIFNKYLDEYPWFIKTEEYKDILKLIPSIIISQGLKKSDRDDAV